MDGPKNKDAELMLARRSKETRFGGDRARAAELESRRVRGCGEPISIELAEDVELRRSRNSESEGKATVPGVLPAFRTGVGKPLFFD